MLRVTHFILIVEVPRLPAFAAPGGRHLHGCDAGHRGSFEAHRVCGLHRPAAQIRHPNNINIFEHIINNVSEYTEYAQILVCRE